MTSILEEIAELRKDRDALQTRVDVLERDLIALHKIIGIPEKTENVAGEIPEFLTKRDDEPSEEEQAKILELAGKLKPNDSKEAAG